MNRHEKRQAISALKHGGFDGLLSPVAQSILKVLIERSNNGEIEIIDEDED